MKIKTLLHILILVTLFSCKKTMEGKYYLSNNGQVVFGSLNFINSHSVIIEENYTGIPSENEYQIQGDKILITSGYFLNYSFTINKDETVIWNGTPIGIFKKK